MPQIWGDLWQQRQQGNRDLTWSQRFSLGGLLMPPPPQPVHTWLYWHSDRIGGISHCYLFLNVIQAWIAAQQIEH